METKLETKLTATQQTMVLALARERQEFNERMDKSMTELTQMLANSYGWPSGPCLFEQRGPDIYLVRQTPSEPATRPETESGELKDSMQ